MRRKNNVDVIIIGAGPAGLSAGIYAIRSGLETLILDKASWGGQTILSAEIENYPAVPSVTGPDFAEKMYQQLTSLGGIIKLEEVKKLDAERKTIETGAGLYQAKKLIIAAGLKRRKLGCPGEEELAGKGVSYCAICDGFFYRQKDVAVIGNGEYALHEAKVLEPMAAKVTILTNGMEPTFEKEALGTIQVETRKIISAGGEPTLKWLELEDYEKFPLDGLFVALGTAGSTDIARKLGLMIENNHIMIETDTSTALPGLFAAGDCTGGLLQVSKAVYEGALAGTKAVKYLKKLPEAV